MFKNDNLIKFTRQKDVRLFRGTSVQVIPFGLEKWVNFFNFMQEPNQISVNISAYLTPFTKVMVVVARVRMFVQVVVDFLHRDGVAVVPSRQETEPLLERRNQNVPVSTVVPISANVVISDFIVKNLFLLMWRLDEKPRRKFKLFSKFIYTIVVKIPVILRALFA
jgi:hypothetical protein